MHGLLRRRVSVSATRASNALEDLYLSIKGYQDETSGNCRRQRSPPQDT